MSTTPRSRVAETFANRLAELGWSCEVAAQHLGEARSTVYAWAAGTHAIRPRKIFKVAEILGIKVEDLLSREG